MRRWLVLLILLLSLPVRAAQIVVSFDDLLPNPNTSIHNMSATNAGVTFVNTYNSAWDSWAGFAFSTVSNTTDGTWLNQYAAAQGLSNAYAVGYDGGWDPSPEILFDLPAAPQSVRIDNTTYAAVAIRDGSAYNRAFTNGDSFELTLTARDIEGNILATTNHYLADFRGGKTFIQTHWSTLDLSWMPPEVVSLVGTLTTTDLGDWGPNTPMYFALADLTYAYAGSASGIAATNPAVLCWADGVASYAPGPNVEAQWQTTTNALGPADVGDGENGSLDVVSLGDNGQITLTFPVPITDGPGPDFAVFENAFTSDFLELAYVEISSDGTNFTRFANHCIETNWIDTYGATNTSDPTAYGGLAGKHTQGIGTPFDLRALVGTPGLDLRRVTHVRIRDILGDGSNRDSYTNPIYDPSPTWGSGGFDLDAVGVLNARIEISPDVNAAAPALPGYTTIKEFTPALTPPTWTNTIPATNTPGFFRYRLVKS